MRCLFLIIFALGFFSCFISSVDSVSSAFETGLEPIESHGHNGLHWDGLSGELLRSWFAPNSQSSSSYSNNGYQYPSQQPIYGNVGYTNGPINQIRTVQTGQYNNYNGYSSNYWTCVNNYRGQYYYSYTFGHYVCDTRANRYGK